MRVVGLRFRETFRARRTLAGLAIGCALVLGGCSSLTGSTPPTTFNLTAPTRVTAKGNGRAQIMVVEPTALAALDSERILVIPGGGQVTYLPGAQWADRLPRLFQARLIQTFENAHRTGMVGRPDDKFTPDALLVTEIRDFQINATAGGAIAEVTIAARVVNQTSGRITAASIFSAKVPASGVNGRAAAAALDQALDKVLIEIMNWTTAKV